MIKLLFCTLMIIPLVSQAAPPTTPKQPVKAPIKAKLRAPSSAAAGVLAKGRSDNPFGRVQELIRAKNFAAASEFLFNLRRTEKNPIVRSKINYFLGLTLYRMRLFQAASFPLIEVVRQGSSSEQGQKALDLLLNISQVLGEPSLVRYAIQSTTLDKVNPATRALYHFLKAEMLADSGDINGARNDLLEARTLDPNRYEVHYALGTLDLQSQNPTAALVHFKTLLDLTAQLPIKDKMRGMTILAMARAHYQAQQWKNSIDFYRQIPKDHALYRQSLLELSWALFRNGQFRSSLSPLLTLHSEYYENFYDPESLLLRSIILLFSCRFDEVDKVHALFEKTYRVTFTQMEDWVKRNSPDSEAFKQFDRILQAGSGSKSETASMDGLPFFVVRSVADERDVASEIKYRSLLFREAKITTATLPVNSSLRKYVLSVLSSRDKTAQKRIGHKVKVHVEAYAVALADYLNRGDFIHYENLSGRRETLKIRIATPIQDDVKIDSKLSRTYFIQNGYRYWPFQGEYWRDEVGNYQFVGEARCGE